MVQQKTDAKKGEVMNGDLEFDELNEELPDAVKAALKKRFGLVPDVPSNVDQLILTDARRHFEQHGPAALRLKKRQRVFVWKWAAIGSSVAAAGVLLFAMRPQQMPEESRMTTTSNAVSADVALMSDVDRSGRVDILDAFAMARRIRSGQDESYDINHDGRFDETDIDIVAREAVKL